ncbi:MAG TPA: trigger factor [Acidisarcina sp.]|nr:trigger factor [Acidisarcina sp.]
MSSTETLDTTPNPEPTPNAEAEHQAAHSHEGHEHEGHDHQHSHGPVLNPDCTREVDIEVPADEVSKTFRSVTKRYQKMARIPGFRAGKVPESLIRTRFADQIRQDVMEALVPDRFRAIVEKEKFQPVSQPQVTSLTVVDGEPIHCKAAFEVLPTFSVEGYQDVKIAKPETELTEEEYQTELERLRDSRATMEPVSEDRALVDGDWTQISFHGDFKPAGDEQPATPAEPVKGEDVVIEVGGKNTLPSFNDALRGAKPGQELKFEVTYPEDFGEQNLAGKTVAYDVEVKAIKKRILPELNDDFAKELGEYETWDAFAEKFREHMANEKRRRLEAEAKDKMIEALIAKFDFPVPETLIQQQVDARLDRGLRALAQQGMRAEDMRKLDFNRLREAQHDSARNEVKGSMVLDRIADEEKIEVTPEDVEQELQILSLQTREPVESLRTRLTEDGSLARIREQLRREKTGNTLYDRLVS